MLPMLFTDLTFNQNNIGVLRLVISLLKLLLAYFFTLKNEHISDEE